MQEQGFQQAGRGRALQCGPKGVKGPRVRGSRKGPSVWPQSCQRAAGQRLQEGPPQCGPKGVKGPRVRGSSKERVVVTQLTQETGAPCWRDPGTALWKRGHVHGATLNTLLL